MNRNDGGPAFPVLGKMSDGEPYAQHEGLSLRDWFAGQVIPVYALDSLPGTAARVAYEYADAMLKVRQL